ncbi:MAG: hypothetical protein FJZ01_07625 [Candidatus Sericytochromatia bacterium]|nr:hypothetical protein [Candidatus Tanganyikabacteria bacterium]
MRGRFRSALLALLAFSAAGCQRLSESERDRVRATFEAYEAFVRAQRDGSALATLSIVNHREAYRRKAQGTDHPAFYQQVFASLALCEQIQQHRRDNAGMAALGMRVAGTGLPLPAGRADSFTSAWKAGYDDLLATASALLDRAPRESAEILAEVLEDTSQRELFVAYACTGAPARPAAFCAVAGK